MVLFLLFCGELIRAWSSFEPRLDYFDPSGRYEAIQSSLDSWLCLANKAQLLSASGWYKVSIETVAVSAAAALLLLFALD